jgi:hypothetical protein
MGGPLTSPVPGGGGPLYQRCCATADCKAPLRPRPSLLLGAVTDHGHHHASTSALAHRALGSPHIIPNRHLPSLETNRCEPSALEPAEEASTSCSRVHVACRPGNHIEVDTPQSSVCPLAGWLKDRSIRLQPPSIRASRSGDWTPHTAYARGVMTTGQLKRPICQNGGSITRSLHGRFHQLASDVSIRGVAPLAAYVPLRRRTHAWATAPSRGLHTRARREDRGGAPGHGSPSG